MKDLSEKNFGVVIAFLLPGFLLLWGLSFSSSEIATWSARSDAKDTSTIDEFFFATLASLAAGLLISAARWATVDQILCLLGVTPTALNFSKLKDKDCLKAFQEAMENHYRYYQYYSNTLVAIIGACAYHFVNGEEWPSLTLLGVVLPAIVILCLASRDCLRKFYARADAILS